MNYKQILKRVIPFSSILLPVYHDAHRAVTAVKLKLQDRRDIFTKYYNTNKWGDAHSRSGEGSNMEQTRVIRALIPRLIEKYSIKSFADIPCGDFFWMKEVDFGRVPYTGCDIVESMIEDNKKQYGSENRKFLCLDLCRDVPPLADMILCRDALVHLSNEDVFRALKNIKTSGARYLLTTNFMECKKNDDIATGMWRPLNLCLAPFNFPPPLEVYNEEYTAQGNRHTDKSIALWDTESIKV